MVIERDLTRGLHHFAIATPEYSRAKDGVILDNLKFVRLEGHEVRLTAKEYRRLELLASQPGRVYAHD